MESDQLDDEIKDASRMERRYNEVAQHAKIKPVRDISMIELQIDVTEPTVPDLLQNDSVKDEMVYGRRLSEVSVEIPEEQLDAEQLRQRRLSATHMLKEFSWLISDGSSNTSLQVAVWCGVGFITALLLFLVFVFHGTVEDTMKINSGLLFGALGTIVTGAIPMLLYIWFPKIRRHGNIMLMNKIVVDVLLAISFLLAPLWHSWGVDMLVDQSSCKWLSLVREYLLMNSNMWILCMALDLRLLSTNPFSSPSSNRRFYQLIVQVFSITMALGVTAKEEYYGLAVGKFCWIRAEDHTTSKFHEFEPNSWLFIYVPIYIIVCISFYILYDSYKRMRHGIHATLKTRRRLLREGFLTSIAFLLYSSLLWTVYYSIWWSNGSSVAVELYTFGLSFRGQVNLVLWVLHNQYNVFAVIVRSTLADDEGDIAPQANVALQKELVFFTTRGIAQAAVHAEKEYAILRPRASTEEVSSFTVDAPLDLHSSSANLPVRRDTIQSITNLHAYHPSQFYRIRCHFGIETEDFLKSFKTCSKPMISEGASGAFMYFSGDRSYIVKSLTKAESDFLNRILSEYLEYLSSNSDTFITRFLGSYCAHLYGKLYYYVVMENIFDTQPGVKIHQRYDIKGSWVNRNATKPRVGSKVACRHCNMFYHYGDKKICPSRAVRHAPNVVLKDMDLTMKLRLGKTVGNKLMQQLQNDSLFLCSKGIMDYSLLLGVVEVSYLVDPKVAQSRDNNGLLPSTSHSKLSSPRDKIKQSYKGIRSSERIVGPGFYYIGIVDILQTWTFRKKIERFFKTKFLRKDPDGISVIEPSLYRARFYRKMKEIIDHDTSSPMSSSENESTVNKI